MAAPVICEHCGTVFCWDDADTILLGSTPKRYCSKACKRNANQRPSQRDKWRNYRSRKACEDRPKNRYDSREEALYAISQIRRIPPLYPYLCRCGSWHLTSQEPPDARLPVPL
jgi:hypothetical protein